MYNVEIRDLKWGKNHDDSVLGHRHYHLLKFLKGGGFQGLHQGLQFVNLADALPLMKPLDFPKTRYFLCLMIS